MTDKELNHNISIIDDILAHHDIRGRINCTTHYIRIYPEKCMIKIVSFSFFDGRAVHCLLFNHTSQAPTKSIITNGIDKAAIESAHEINGKGPCCCCVMDVGK